MNIKAQMLSYTWVNIITSSVPFLLLPIMTSYLHPSEYGILSLIHLLMVISLPLVMMNSQGLIRIDYSKFDFHGFQRFLSTIIWIPIAGFVFLEFIFYIYGEYIEEYFQVPNKYIYYIPLFVLMQAIPTIVGIIFQAKKEPLNFGKYKISMTITNFILSLLFVIVFELGWQGRFLGIIISFVIFSIIGFIILVNLNLLKLTFEKKILKEILKFGLPLIPHTIAGVFLAMSDRVFLANMLDNEAVGVYSVAFQVSSAVALIMNSINQAWAPNLYEKLNDNPSLEDKKILVNQTYKIMFGMTVVVLLFVFISPYVYNLLVDKSYYDGQKLVVFISFSFLFQGFYYMVCNYIFFSKKTYILSYITVFSIVIVFASNYFLIQEYGIIGSAYAMLITWVIFFLICWKASNKVYPMPWLFFIR